MSVRTEGKAIRWEHSSAHRIRQPGLNLQKGMQRKAAALYGSL